MLLIQRVNIALASPVYTVVYERAPAVKQTVYTCCTNRLTWRPNATNALF
jgi:hypothetical protein